MSLSYVSQCPSESGKNYTIEEFIIYQVVEVDAVSLVGFNDKELIGLLILFESASWWIGNTSSNQLESLYTGKYFCSTWSHLSSSKGLETPFLYIYILYTNSAICHVDFR